MLQFTFYFSDRAAMFACVFESLYHCNVFCIYRYRMLGKYDYSFVVFIINELCLIKYIYIFLPFYNVVTHYGKN